MGPALRCNLFVFKEKTKRISTSIRAKERDRASLLLLKTTKLPSNVLYGFENFTVLQTIATAFSNNTKFGHSKPFVGVPYLQI